MNVVRHYWWLYNWASRKKLSSPLLRISIFLKFNPPLDFQSNFTWLPWNFHFFCIDAPWKSTFFPQFLVFPPWNSTNIYSDPWNFPLISSTGRRYNFYHGKSHYLFFRILEYCQILQRQKSSDFIIENPILMGDQWQTKIQYRNTR